MDDIWKQFEQNPISHSAAHHIVAIVELLERNGYARVSDVAKLLNITRGSASLTLKSLKQRGLVAEDENRFLKLSDEGETVASSVRGRAFLIRRFFMDVLDLPSEDAEVDACKIEHLLSLATAERLAQFLRYFCAKDSIAVAFREGWEQYEGSCDWASTDSAVCQIERIAKLACEVKAQDSEQG
ncbi:MAG: metal-dependent transcriptional regulator [Phycisphaerae bacterium]|nr:metal-dependent transcriptional regulator [Phycisphaerae bacterium]